MDLGLVPTLTGMAICAVLAVLGGWRGSLPPNPAKGPRMIPWTLIAVLAGGFGIMLFVHLVNLLGFETGQGRRF